MDVDDFAIVPIDCMFGFEALHVNYSKRQKGLAILDELKGVKIVCWKDRVWSARPSVKTSIIGGVAGGGCSYDMYHVRWAQS